MDANARWFLDNATMTVASQWHHFDVMDRNVRLKRMTPQWEARWKPYMAEDSDGSEPEDVREGKLPTDYQMLPSKSVFSTRPVFTWPGWYAFVRSGREGTHNLACLKPDRNAAITDIPTRYVPLVIGVVYATTAASWAGEDDIPGNLYLVALGPRLFKEFNRYIAIYVEAGMMLDRGADSESFCDDFSNHS